jgi:hypothetical protein
MHMHIDQTSLLEQHGTRSVKPARTGSSALFANPVAQTRVAVQVSAERSLLCEPHPSFKPLLTRLPRPSGKRLQQQVKLRICPTLAMTTTKTTNPHPELETVLTDVRRRHPRVVVLSNVCPQVRQRFIPERDRRPDRPKIASKRLPQQLMTLKPLSQTRTQPQPQRKPVIAPIPARNRHPAVLDLEPSKAPQEILIDRTIVDETIMPSRDTSHSMIMLPARANSPHSRPHGALLDPHEMLLLRGRAGISEVILELAWGRSTLLRYPGWV